MTTGASQEARMDQESTSATKKKKKNDAENKAYQE